MSPYWDAAFLFGKTQNFAMLPNAIFSTWQGTQNPDTKQTLPRAKKANAQPARPSRQNYSQLFDYLEQPAFINI